jgi:hypothetical protein
MKVEIVIQCIDDGRVPKHQIFTYNIKGNESRDVRMRRLGRHIVEMMREKYPKEKNRGSAPA